MIEYLKKLAEVEPMKSQDAETVASTFFNCWVCQHGVTDSVHSDQSPNFERRLFTELCKSIGIAESRTAPKHTWSNGRLKTNRTLTRIPKAFTMEAWHEDRDFGLGCAFFAYRTTVHASTGVPPFKKLMGREMIDPLISFYRQENSNTQCFGVRTPSKGRDKKDI